MIENENTEKEEKRKSKKILIIILLFLILICVGVYFGIDYYNQYMAKAEYEDITLKNTEPQVNDDELLHNPIDFESLCSGNDDIFAWIVIYDTNVNYPIVQSDGDDAFYLTHSAVDKSYLKSGAVYIESCNSNSFSDPITAVYGHNNYGDTMFTTLHYFEDKDFFDNHEYFHIYMQGRRLTYQIISAFKYDDRHIIKTNDFSNTIQLLEFQQFILNPQSEMRNVRTELDVEIDENSNIVVLSTCITGDKSSRYLVCAVLVKDEKTD